MQQSILGGLVVMGVAAAAVGAGTFAFFTDTGKSTENIFTATTLDLKLGGQNDVTATIGSTAFSPGDVVTGSIDLTNTGTLTTGTDLDVAFDVSVTDSGTAGNMDKFLTVSELKYGSRDLLSTTETCWGTTTGPKDNNANGVIDLEDLSAQSCKDLAAPGSTATAFSAKVTFATGATNAEQGDKVTLGMRFLLAQSGEVDVSAGTQS